LKRHTTKEERALHTAKMRANFALEGLFPQAEDLDLQRRYIHGEISLADMLKSAAQFAHAAQRAIGPHQL